MASIFIWNKNKYATRISDALVDVNVITSESEFSPPSIDRMPNNVVILAELYWGNKKLSEFYGFEILCQFRAEYRLKCPIAICSFMPEPLLRKKFPILEFPQHHPFIQLPTSPMTFIEKVVKAEIADEFRLNDIIMNYCDLRGRLMKLITHGKGFRQITRSLDAKQENNSIWSACQDDLALLKKYVANKSLSSLIHVKADMLVEKLQEAIRLENLELLLATKHIFEKIFNELTSAKNISTSADLGKKK